MFTIFINRLKLFRFRLAFRLKVIELHFTHVKVIIILSAFSLQYFIVFDKSLVCRQNFWIMWLNFPFFCLRKFTEWPFCERLFVFLIAETFVPWLPSVLTFVNYLLSNASPINNIHWEQQSSWRKIGRYEVGLGEMVVTWPQVLIV